MKTEGTVKSDISLSRVAQVVEAVPSLTEVSASMIRAAKTMKERALYLIQEAAYLEGEANKLWGRIERSGEWSAAELEAALRVAPQRQDSE